MFNEYYSTYLSTCDMCMNIILKASEQTSNKFKTPVLFTNQTKTTIYYLTINENNNKLLFVEPKHQVPQSQYYPSQTARNIY